MMSIWRPYACFLQNYVTTQRETRLQNVYKIIKHDEQSSMIFLGVLLLNSSLSRILPSEDVLL